MSQPARREKRKADTGCFRARVVKLQKIRLL
jgi:hypothetical protein